MKYFIDLEFIERGAALALAIIPYNRKVLYRAIPWHS